MNEREKRDIIILKKCCKVIGQLNEQKKNKIKTLRNETFHEAMEC